MHNPRQVIRDWTYCVFHQESDVVFRHGNFFVHFKYSCVARRVQEFFERHHLLARRWLSSESFFNDLKAVDDRVVMGPASVGDAGDESVDQALGFGFEPLVQLIRVKAEQVKGNVAAEANDVRLDL